MGATPARRRAWREAARSVLAPLVEALIAQGLRYEDLVELVQEVLSDVIGRQGSPSAAARRRVGLPRTGGAGAHRSDAAPRLSYADGARLISRWLLDTPKRGRTRATPLPLTGAGSFTALATNAGIDPKLALIELRRLGLVRVRGRKVMLQRDAYLPGGVEEKLDILGRDGAEFLRTMIHNVDRSAKQSMLQRKASYDNVGSAALGGIRSQLRDEAIRVLAGVNQKLARVDRDRNPSAPRGRRMRISFGVYLLEEPFADSAEPPRRTPSRRSRRSS